MAGKADLIELASQIGKEEELKYIGCSQSTFSAICKTFRIAGMPLMDRQDEEKIFKGMIGLLGGCGSSAKGSCGACSGAAFCVSWALDKSREDNHEDLGGTINTVSVFVKEGIVDRFIGEYGSCVCRDIQFCKFGKAVDFLAQGNLATEFLTTSETHEACRNGNCTIAKAAAWGVEAICDIKGIKENIALPEQKLQMPGKWLATMVRGDEFKKVVVKASSHSESREVALKENPGYEVIVTQSYEKD